jgi:hypothetical protein
VKRPSAGALLLVMDGLDEVTLAQLRRRVAPAHLIAARSRDVPRVVNAFQIASVVVAGDTVTDPDLLLMHLPRTVPIERVFSSQVTTIAECLHRALAQ